MPGREVSVVQVRGVLLVTLPADPDDATILNLQETILGLLEGAEARALILDLSAVEVFDSFFARTVCETACMVALMGGRSSIVGMRPAVAITATQLGLTMDPVERALTVDQALDRFLGTAGRIRP